MLKEIDMNIYVFRTDLKTSAKVQQVESLLNNHPSVCDWSVDTEDIDNVLRIESKGVLTEADVIRFVTTYGFHCEILED